MRNIIVAFIILHFWHNEITKFNEIFMNFMYKSIAIFVFYVLKID